EAGHLYAVVGGSIELRDVERIGDAYARLAATADVAHVRKRSVVQREGDSRLNRLANGLQIVPTQEGRVIDDAVAVLRGDDDELERDRLARRQLDRQRGPIRRRRLRRFTAIERVEHLRARHERRQLDRRAIQRRRVHVVQSRGLRNAVAHVLLVEAAELVRQPAQEVGVFARRGRRPRRLRER